MKILKSSYSMFKGISPNILHYPSVGSKDLDNIYKYLPPSDSKYSAA